MNRYYSKLHVVCMTKMKTTNSFVLDPSPRGLKDKQAKRTEFESVMES
jgi:hypothetical protein